VAQEQGHLTHARIFTNQETVGRNKHTKKNRSLLIHKKVSTLTKTGILEAVIASGKIGDEKQIENGIRASGNQISPGYEAAAPNKIFFKEKKRIFTTVLEQENPKRETTA
jgi:hypothetical protein